MIYIWKSTAKRIIYLLATNFSYCDQVSSKDPGIGRPLFEGAEKTTKTYVFFMDGPCILYNEFSIHLSPPLHK